MARKYPNRRLLWNMTTTERGRWGETLAVIHLENKNLRILSRNWRWGRYELDLVGRTGNTWVFIEVKVRKRGRVNCAVDAVDGRKRRRIILAAHQFLRVHDIDAAHIRFDIVSIEYAADFRRIHHLEDAFFSLP